MELSELDNHYRKRMSQDRICWQNLLAKPAITQEDYEQASLSAVQNQVIEVSYVHVEAGRLPRRRRSCFDAKSVRSIVTNDRSTFITCFHQHDMRGQHHDRASTPQKQLYEVAIQALLKEEWLGSLQKPQPDIRSLRSRS